MSFYSKMGSSNVPNGRSRMRAGAAILNVMLLVFTAPAWSQDEGASNVAGPAAPAITSITKAAVELGVLSCAARVQQVTSFLGVTAETKSTIRRPLSPADQNSFYVLTTVQTDGTTALAMAEFFPSSQGCKATYSLTLNLSQPCETVRSERFVDLGEGALLSDNIRVMTNANAMRISLISSGETCTLIKTETLD